MKMKKILVIITTEPQRSNAEKISKLLIEKKLAACISLKEISSSYFWKGNIETSNEIEITIKSTLEKREVLINTLKNKLSNEVPQIVFKEYDSELDYFNWIKVNVN
tara:strand:- start:227 stop:544 length:318 start_codon:yes stop_codon:yes gene_type:complete